MMRLAEHLGRPLEGPDGVRGMSSEELNQWIAWENINGPLGHSRTDMLLAQLAQVVAEVNRNPKKRSKPFALVDFIPFRSAWAKPRRLTDPMEIMRRLAAFSGHRVPTHIVTRSRPDRRRR